MSHNRKVLVLFDIDGTLVDCGRIAGKCFSSAFQKIFGLRCPKLKAKEMAGLTDAAILALVLRRARLVLKDSAELRKELFEDYCEGLTRNFLTHPPRALSGADEAVKGVRALPGCLPGLLTGSTAASAKIKLEFAGIGFEQFVCGAFSEDGARRELLPPVAQSRFTAILGHKPDQTILVGDTPRDLEAAQATGCEFIGVATGPYTEAALRATGAVTVLPDLSDTDLFCAAVSRLAFSHKDACS